MLSAVYIQAKQKLQDVVLMESTGHIEALIPRNEAGIKPTRDPVPRSDFAGFSNLKRFPSF
jgi:hypothetical protein